MCTCKECGAAVCQYCNRGDCTGDKECLQAKVERLEKRVKELEAKPMIPIMPNPYPVYYPVSPWTPQPTITPFPQTPFWCERTIGVSSTAIDLPADGTTHSIYLQGN